MKNKDLTWARQVYQSCKSIYHPVAVVKVEKILGLNEQKALLSESMIKEFEQIRSKY